MAPQDGRPQGQTALDPDALDPEVRDPEARVRRGRLIARLAMGGAAVLILAMIAGVSFFFVPKGVPAGAASDLPSNGLEVWSRAGERGGLGAAWMELNDAMAAGDREAFLAFADGDEAKESLARWWDGTKAIGWDLGYALPSARYEESTGSTIDQITLGAQLAFSAHADRGSGLSSAGLKLTQSFNYDVSYSVNDGDTLKISAVTPTADSRMPWDDGEVYAAKRDHVVLFGLASEKALIDGTVEEAEAAAKLALDKTKQMGGDPPLDGFVAAITDSEDAFSRWYGPDQVVFDVAGIATQTLKPASTAMEIDPEIAVGEGNSGMIVTMSPKSADDRTAVFVHEFAHVIHETAAPDEQAFVIGHSQKVEGFARFFENYAGVGNGYFGDPRTAQNILNLGEGALSDDIFNSEDAHLFYSAAGSYYQFVADTGGDPWKVALGWNSDQSLLQLGTARGAQFDLAHWQEWVRQQAGG